MRAPQRNKMRLGLAGLLGVALAGSPLVAVTAQANPAGTGVVINEAYVNGGSAGAAFTTKFVELYNPTDAAISLVGMSLQYRPASGTANPSGNVALTGSIAADGYYLIGGGSNGTNGAALPAPDVSNGGINAAGAGGTFFLVDGTDTLASPPTGSVVSDADTIVDLLGFGSSLTFETTPASTASVTVSLNRSGGVDTDVNSADFSTAAPTPTNAAGDAPVEPEPEPEPEPVEPGAVVPIADIQGTTDTSPLDGTMATTRGVVTASYPTGGLNGYYIQTPGSGAVLDASSEGIFVYSPATVAAATVGSYVEVTGTVDEYFGLTQISVLAGGMSVLDEGVAAPVPAAVELSSDPAQRESLEGMLLAPAGDYTVTDNYDTNFYGSIGLTAGDSPLVQPTTVVEPGSDEYFAMLAANKAAVVTLDDGSTTNFNTNANKSIPLPYLSTTEPVRIGAAVSFETPVILDYRFGAWSFQPTQQLTVANAATVQPASFENTRTASPKDVGGDVKIATFNVLNYFSTTGDELDGCTFYTDRAGDPVTVNRGCDARGAAEQEDLDRQQAKIVAALNELDADVVGLQEIENSAAFGKDRDEALAELTAALNAAAGDDRWAFVPSPSAVPANEDVIRTAFIYQPAVVDPQGASVILDDDVAFVNARKPLAQAFQFVGGGADDEFLAIVNHFKSKGSGSGPGNADSGDGQGGSNASRVLQAEALVNFADTMKADSGIDRVFLTGDFNSYAKEDPIDVLAEAGYVDLGGRTGKQTYSFDGMTGSLDYIFASAEAVDEVTGVDIWSINSVESIALEYSRFNYNATNFYEPNAYRASDHDPVIAGIDFSASEIVDLNLLNFNDLHGRIDNNTVKFAGTIEQLRAEGGEDNTLLLSAGDSLGASLFASAAQNDQPTIDVLNALELDASSVGNHEFDQGVDDLTGRIAASADWNYLAANVYRKGTTEPVLDEYEIIEVDGVRVAIIGAVTSETPALVSPAGIADLDFGDPVDAVNRVVDELVAADLADVFVAEYHEGSGAGETDGATLEDQLAITDSAFTKIVTQTSAEVDAIFTGHTHKRYAWDAPVPGEPGETRPVLQTGNYGEFIGQVVLSVDTASDEVLDYTARNVPRTTTDDATLVSTYPRVAEVKTIVDAAIAAAAVIGNEPIGEVTADITRASTDPTTVTEDRASESTIGNLVADSLLASLSDPTLGGAEIGVANPGGLRADLLYASSTVGEGDGVVTFGEANAVLPFVNNLWTTTLTGAQFTTVLEQQWQTDADGNIPSRPFLNLGLSDNVNYTYDASRAQGDRVTGITVDGAPIDPARNYRIGSFSFLLQGGDNFREFTNGTNTRDSGLIDRDAWTDYISANSPLTPSFDRRGVSVTDVPAEVLEVGATGSVTLSKLDLTSLGSPANTEVSASFEGSSAAPTISPVTAGSSTVGFTVPGDVPANATLVIVAKESGTTVRVSLAVDPTPATPTPPASAPVAAGERSLTKDLKGDITVDDSKVAAGEDVTVTVGEQYAGQFVAVFLYSKKPALLGNWMLVDEAGQVTVTIPADTKQGRHKIAVQNAASDVLGWTDLNVQKEKKDKPEKPGKVFSQAVQSVVKWFLSFWK